MGRQGSGPLRSKWRWHVAHWIPNIFTYIRIAALVKAFSVAFTDKNEFTALYSVCFVANELSRNIAHFMNCSSTFGDGLAHVSSRASNTGLLIVLSHLYKRDFRVFVLLLELDIVSHWFRIYCEVMSKRCPCLHLQLYQNSLYKTPLFRLFCALSQEIMYMTLYLISFDWMEHGHPVKLDFLRNKDHMHSKYFKSLVIAAPGYLIRQIATLDEIRLATDMCIHFDNQKYCCDKSPQPPCEPPAQPHLHLVTSTRRGRSRSRPRKRTRSRSEDRFDHAWFSYGHGNCAILYPMVKSVLMRRIENRETRSVLVACALDHRCQWVTVNEKLVASLCVRLSMPMSYNCKRHCVL